MKFEKYQIADSLKKSIHNLGYKRPTDIQFKSIPHILNGEDVLAVAQTGTGKTAAFAIPVINNIYQKKKNNKDTFIRCVVLVPTRELAIQITKVFNDLEQFTNIQSLCIHGGEEQDPQISRLTSGVDIIIATPGRLFDLVSQKHIDLRQTETLILDEADHMLDLGFIKDIRDIIRLIPFKHQTLFFSATINDSIKKLAYSIVHKPFRIQISPKDPISKNITHSIALIQMDDKRFFLERIIKENPDAKFIIFVRTRVRAERVLSAMNRVHIECLNIHGDKEQEERNLALSKFKNDECKILIATDVSARGIDIPNVEYVVNYDIPDDPENYIHRVGRTGRGKNKGIAVSFCSEEEKEKLQIIEEYIQNTIPILDIDYENYQNTIDLTEDSSNNWKNVMKEIYEQENFSKEVQKKKSIKKQKEKKKKSLNKKK